MTKFAPGKPTRTYNRIKERNWRKFLAATTVSCLDAADMRRVEWLATSVPPALRDSICAAMDATQ